MVAEMASFSSHLDEGDGEIPALEQKGQLTESEPDAGSGSSSSSEDSSEEDEEEEEEEEADSGCAERDAEEGEPGKSDAEPADRESDSAPRPEAGAAGGEAAPPPCCEKCSAVPQSHGGETVTPRRLARGKLQAQLEAEGTWECSVTGLVFEVSRRVLLRYSVLSWSRFGGFLGADWRFAGPIFDVECVDGDSSVLTSIQFPHSLCLADPAGEMTFSVLHMKERRPSIEPCAEHSGSHVKWRVTSLSPVGPIVQSARPVEHHGVVLLYRELGQNNAHSFRVYLAPNNSSDIKDIGKEVRSAKKRFLRVDKPPTCQLDERRYRLTSQPDGDITPEDLPFTLAVTKLKGYFEAFFENSPPFKLSLLETDSDQVVWSATIREIDCLDNAVVVKPRKRIYNRKSSNSTSEEEATNKRPRWADEPDGVRAAGGAGGPGRTPDMTDKQLLQVAKRLGKEWKQVGIFLDLSSKDLEEIVAGDGDGSMQRFRMLVEWRRRRTPGQATAAHLADQLDDLDDLPNEVRQLLQDMTDSRAAK